MQIDIRTSNVTLNTEHREHIARRASFALSRLGHRIRRVEVRLADVNGPRGGIDKRCRVLVHLNSGTPMLVETKGLSLPELIDRAMDRVGRAVRKRIGALTQVRHASRAANSLAALS
jgi:putative sigma-54 modulation protein